MNVDELPHDPAAALPDDGSVVTGVEVGARRVPLRRPWGPDVQDVRVLTVRITTATGAVGEGFSWTPSIGAGAVRALLEDDVRPFLVGRPAHPRVWSRLWSHLHEAGSGGITTMALAGVDLALWDLVGRARGTALADLLGRRREPQPVYGSGVNLHYSLPELRDQVRRWVDAGYTGAKVKVGLPDLAEDLRRVAAVREVLGDGRTLMVDANQRWDLPRALRASRALAEFSPAWLEEPLRADDTAGHVRLRREGPLRVAAGENVHTWYRFRDLLTAGALDVVQPNVIRVGGITPFLSIAHLARSAGAELAPHLLPELSGQLAVTFDEAVWVEDVEDAGFWESGALSRPVGGSLAGGAYRAGDRPGLGFRFHEDPPPGVPPAQGSPAPAGVLA
ncbi:mandelate racemase/muconate lactonizing enzyme family protein [Kineococcus sp. SYSU DK001]|uniref:mandelate racemase/muconate lactonizing enzyme family protein n=1 Tax=Kineococcus sp. SYSU DK001 TaxID=3383122 RepID=UPI003D7E6B30